MILAPSVIYHIHIERVLGHLCILCGQYLPCSTSFSMLRGAYKKSSMRFIAAVNGATAIKMLTSLALATTYLVAVGGEYRIQFAMGLFVAFAANNFLLVAEAQKLSKERLD